MSLYVKPGRIFDLQKMMNNLNQENILQIARFN